MGGPLKSCYNVFGLLKSISANECFEKTSKMRKGYEEGKRLEPRYFLRIVGGYLTAKLLKRFINKYQANDVDSRLFNKLF